MRKTIHELIDNRSGELIQTFSYPVGVFVRSGTAHELLDEKTGEVIDSFPFSIRVRVRLTDIGEYKKTHSILNRGDV